MPEKFNKLAERRRFIRLQVPAKITYTELSRGRIHNVILKNMSADGLRFEVRDKALETADILALKMNIPEEPNIVGAKGKVVWKNKTSLEDRATFDVGVEIVEIDELDKNIFLKFLCDLMYKIPEEGKNVKKKQ